MDRQNSNISSEIKIGEKIIEKTSVLKTEIVDAVVKQSSLNQTLLYKQATHHRLEI